LSSKNLNAPIAIIGSSARFPGAASADQYWENLLAGRDCIQRFSNDELERAGISKEDLANPHYVKAAPTIVGADCFDADFFQYSPREAALIDPQQRLFLECAWAALEHAGYRADSDMRVGVFGSCGANVSSYAFAFGDHFLPALGRSGGLHNLASDKDYLTTRVSFKLGLRGPSFCIQSACSSSMGAVHLARSSLLSGECDMALAGGVTVRVPLVAGYHYTPGGILSSDGRCRVFDASADGTVFGSGVGLVVLKRLEDAVADGDHIYAIVRGSAVNNDGSRKSNYSAPSEAGQAEAIRSALRSAGLGAHSIHYLEMHGTGTQIGDPQEVAAFRAALLDDGSGGDPCYVGSAKACIGHLDAASGIAGILKAVYVLRNKAIPPIAHLQQLNPKIELAGSRFVFPRVPMPWQGEGQMRACVNSLGIGGTNAHVVLESWEEEASPGSEEGAGGRGVLVLSARTEEALREQARRYGGMLTGSQARVEDIAYTAAVGRVWMEERLVVSAEDWGSRLEEFAASGESGRGVWRGNGRERKKVGFLYAGQGSQYAGMGGELYRGWGVFREAIDELSEVVAGEWGAGELQRLLQEGSPEEIGQTRRTQALLYALEMGLTRVWSWLGVEPDVVLGHSVGEYAAAAAAGVYSAAAGMRLIAWRGERMGRLGSGGAMAALLCGEEQAGKWLTAGVEIAAENGPSSVVISGEEAVVEGVLSRALASGVVGQRLAVSHAFHSARMEPMLGEWGEFASDYGGAAGQARWVSTLSGEELERVDGLYWRRQVRERVRYRAAVEKALALGCEVLVEIGPGSTLTSLGKRCGGNERTQWLTSLDNGRPVLEETAARLWAAGVPVEWERVYAKTAQAQPRRRVSLPTYPFQRQRHWLESKEQGDGDLGRQITSPLVRSTVFERSLPSAPDNLRSHLQGIVQKLESRMGKPLEMAHLQSNAASIPAGPLVTQAIVTEQADGAHGFDWFVRPLAELQSWARVASASLFDRTNTGTTAVRQIQPRSGANLDGILYRSVWRSQARLPSTTEPDSWCLLLSDENVPWERQLLAALEAGGKPVWTVRRTTSYSQQGSSFAIRYNQPEDFERVFDTIPRAAAVVCLWTAATSGLPAWLPLNTALLHLTKALLRTSRSHRLLLISQLATILPGDAPSAPTYWTAVGFGRVLSQEHPELGGVRIDISSDTAVAELTAELRAAWSACEGEIVLRPGQRLVRRFVAADVPVARPSLSLRPDAAYVIAGGSGGLGKETAFWLAAKGASRIVLLQRRSPDAEFLAKLNALGVLVTIELVDLADRTTVQTVFDRLQSQGIPVAGVVHAAGAMEQGLIATTDADQLDRLFPARVAGAWNLHSATASLTLDFFVCYSSLAAALGVVGLSTYSSTHTFLDGLAEFRRSLGLPALSVQWSAWEDIGLGKLIGVREDDQFSAHGGQHIRREESFQMLERLLSSDFPVAAVLRMDWAKLGRLYPRGRTPRFLQEILGAEVEPETTSRPSTLSPREIVLQQLCETLQMKNPHTFPLDRPLRELGLDSMLAIELRNHLGRALDRTMPATLLFDYPTGRKLIEHLANPQHNEPSAAGSPVPLRVEAEMITEAEAESRLRGKLDRLIAKEWR
jgi:acyl transferase domain-containing protein